MNHKPIQIPDGAFLVYNQMIFPISKEFTLIGRSPDNDVVLQEAGVSRTHAQIRYTNGKFILYDLKSNNGTHVNKKSISKFALKSGTLFYLGDVALVFVENNQKVTDNLEMDTDKLPSLE